MSIGEARSQTATLRRDAAPRRSAWIISPAADLMLLIASPLAIVPLVLLVATQRFTVEQISLVAVAFASIGHQLPGFLRAYSDLTLFARYRWRLLLGPPIVLLGAWLIARTQLHGLILLLLVWSTWHVLMQTYGMLRIYEMKRFGATRGYGRLDFWACVALFAWGFVGSEARLFVLAETAWQVGLPMLTARGAEILRWTVGGGALVVLGCYLWSLARDFAAGQLVWVKPLLLLSTGGLYWICGLPIVPVLLGIAMFEIFHAIQYDALVWSYDQQLGHKVGRRFGPLRRFFEGRGSFALLYLAAIAAFGGLRLLADVIDEQQTRTLLLAALTATTILHFYFDGFIWKVSAASQPATDDSAAAPRPWQVPHALQCTGLALAVGGLLFLEAQRPASANEEKTWLVEAATWAPHLAEVQQRLSRTHVAEGDLTAAIRAAERAIELRPDSAEAHADLGAVLLRAERYDDAAAALNEAHRLEPTRWQHLFDLGLAQTQLANWSAAEKAFVAADQAAPRTMQIQRGWADLELARGDAPAAAARLRKLIDDEQSDLRPGAAANAELARQAIAAYSAAGQHDQAVDAARAGTETETESVSAWRALGQALIAAGRYREALTPLNRALTLRAQDAETRYQLGLAELQLGDRYASARQFKLALDADPQHARAWFQQAGIAYASGDLPVAEKAYRQTITLKPRWAEAHSNLGAVLFAQQDWPAAAEEYRTALQLDPSSAAAHYNLGLLLMLQDDLNGARREITRAVELGQQCSPEVAEQLGLKL